MLVVGPRVGERKGKENGGEGRRSGGRGGVGIISTALLCGGGGVESVLCDRPLEPRHMV